MTPSTTLLVLRMLDLVAAAAIMAPELRARYKSLQSKVETMVKEGRDPTQEEWAELDAETEKLIGDL